MINILLVVNNLTENIIEKIQYSHHWIIILYALVLNILFFYE